VSGERTSDLSANSRSFAREGRCQAAKPEAAGVRRGVPLGFRPQKPTHSAISCCYICIYGVDRRFNSAKICQNGIDCEFTDVDCRSHGIDCEPAIINCVLLFLDVKNTFPELQTHMSRCDLCSPDLETSFSGFRAANRRLATHNPELQNHNLKNVNRTDAIHDFISCLACFHSFALNPQSPRYGALPARRGMQGSRGGRDSPAVRPQPRRSLEHAAERDHVRKAEGLRHPILKQRRGQ